MSRGNKKLINGKTTILPQVALIRGRVEKFNLFSGAEKLLDLINRTKPCFVHIGYHHCDDQPTSSVRPLPY
ncbi:hypothetical protein NTGM5_70010 [Candidatus Nitrotoga sp. M5]|nr:hypothetical protein NTGM5_70010 [Candidatus Nitrotoga sp. M5]